MAAKTRKTNIADPAKIAIENRKGLILLSYLARQYREGGRGSGRS
jgi:hypothetical protein